MVRFRLKRDNILVLILVLCWTTLSLADEWDRMHIRKIEPRRDPPNVSLKSLDGKRVTLDDYKGKVVFLNFWTTWCGYCKREMPSMDKLYKEFKDKGLVILGIDVRESVEQVKSFWKRYDLTFPTVIDPTGMAAMAFGVRGYPATFFIDRQGRVAGSAPGARDWYSEDSKTLISKLLEEKGGEGESAEKGNEERKTESSDEEVQVDQVNEESRMATFDLKSVAGPPAYSQGNMTVRSGQVFDFDKGVIGNEREADVSWSEVGFSTRSLIPQNGAEFSNKGIPEQVTFEDIILAKYSGSPINGSEGEKNKLRPGTVLYARTNEGRFACFRIDHNGRDLDITWVTYEKD